MGRDGGDGHAHREGSHRGHADAACTAASVEARPRGDDAGCPLGRTTRVARRSGSAGRWGVREGRGTHGPQGSRATTGREPGDHDRALEWGAVWLRGRALPAGGDDLLAYPRAVAAHPDLGGWGLA